PTLSATPIPYTTLFRSLDSMKKKYFHSLLGSRGVKVRAPRVTGVEQTTLGKITTIPKVVQKNLNEIELQPILKNFSYVRILYDTDRKSTRLNFSHDQIS